MPSLMLPILISLASIPQTTTMGDGTISGNSIAPYEYSWRQCSFVNGEWKNGSDLIEMASIIGQHVLRIEQMSSPQPGVNSRVSHYLDRATLAPIRSEARFTGADGNVLAERLWTFDADGHQATISQGGKITKKSGKLSNNMYNSVILGIPLATIDSWDKPITLTGMMTQFDASYTITATQKGSMAIESDDGEVNVRWIDVHWLHNEIGDIYPPGPDASGGRYWITEKAESDLPRILRYKTDSYVVEYLPQYCSVEEAEEGN